MSSAPSTFTSGMSSLVPERIRWAVAQLALRPAARVLEVGCGPGHAITLLCEQLRQGSVTAIDRSALQVRRARAQSRARRARECPRSSLRDHRCSGRARPWHVRGAPRRQRERLLDGACGGVVRGGRAACTAGARLRRLRAAVSGAPSRPRELAARAARGARVPSGGGSDDRLPQRPRSLRHRAAGAWRAGADDLTHAAAADAGCIMLLTEKVIASFGIFAPVGSADVGELRG